jgi:acyl transferase domain-containing protein
VFTMEPDGPRPVVLVVPGVGDDYPGMAGGLVERLPVFRRELSRCFRLVERESGIDLRALLYPPGAERRAPTLGDVVGQRTSRLEIHRTAVAQPLAFATRYALVRTLIATGVTPSALLGYSVGEFVCACVAGVFTLEDAVRVIAGRARLVDALPEGAVLAVGAAPETLASHVDGEGAHIAALDGPELTVVAGSVDAVEHVQKQLAAHDIASYRLASTHAFHTPMMDPVVEPLRELLGTLPLRPPSVPLLSNVTGTWIRDEDAVSPGYWASHLSRTIRFADNLAALAGLDRPIPVECGPGQTLTNLALRHTDCRGLALRTLPGVFETRTDVELFLATIGRLWAAGVDITVPKALLGAQRSVR